MKSEFISFIWKNIAFTENLNLFCSIIQNFWSFPKRRENNSNGFLNLQIEIPWVAKLFQCPLAPAPWSQRVKFPTD